MAYQQQPYPAQPQPAQFQQQRQNYSHPQQQHQQPYPQMAQQQYQANAPMAMTEKDGKALQKDWDKDLCGWNCSCCFHGNCLLTFCCPCIQIGRTATRRHGKPDDTLSWCCNWRFFVTAPLSYCQLVGCFLWWDRGHMRREHDIDGNCCKDCLASVCCPCCTIIQMDNQSKCAKPLKGQARQAHTAAYTGQSNMEYRQAGR